MSLRRLVLGCALVIGAAVPRAAQVSPRPQPYCIRGVSLDRAGTLKGTLVLRDGAIEAVLDEAAPSPPGVRVIEGAGLICLPAFLDAFTRHGCAVPQPVKDQDLPPNESSDVGIDMRLANRKGVQPAFRVASVLAITKDQAEAWRRHGFGAALVAPGGELLSGTSTLSTTREAAMRDLVLRDQVFAHAAFTASGPGYPSTLMGYFAQLRQFLLDSRHQGELEERYAQGRPGLRPPFDAQLAAGADLVTGRRALVCEADDADDIERWLRLADEFDLEPDIVGGLEAWKVEDLLSRRGTTVVLTLDWGKEVKDPRIAEKARKAPTAVTAPEESQDQSQPPAVGEAKEATWEYEEPFAVRLERRKLWEQGRDCAQRLCAAGVRFTFGSASGKPAELLEHVRTLVEAGLPAEAALAALTRDAAEFLGVGQRLGSIAVGHDATLVLWRSDPLTDDDASPAWVFVDGFPSEFEPPKKKAAGKAGAGPAEGVDPTGTWELEFEADDQGVREATLTLEMEEGGSVSGTIEFADPMESGRVEAEVEGTVSGDQLELECAVEMQEFRIEVTVTATIDGEELEGESSFQPPGSEALVRRTFRAVRRPE